MAKRTRFRGDIWFKEEVHRKVKQSLAMQERDFAQQHSGDSEQQLAEYVRRFSEKLGHTPGIGEMIGGQYIAQRFGGWENAVKTAGLPKPATMPQLQHRMIYKREYKKQVTLLQQARTEEKAASVEQARERAAAANQEKQERLEQDMAWGKDHETDTDEQLLDYLRQRAEELGHSPVSREIIGAAYIAGRFVSWPMALTCAGLELPKGMKPPKDKDVQEYRKLRQQRLAGGE